MEIVRWSGGCGVRMLCVFPVVWVVKRIQVMVVGWCEWVEVSLVVGCVVKLEVRWEGSGVGVSVDVAGRWVG